MMAALLSALSSLMAAGIIAFVVWDTRPKRKPPDPPTWWEKPAQRALDVTVDAYQNELMDRGLAGTLRAMLLAKQIDKQLPRREGKP